MPNERDSNRSRIQPGAIRPERSAAALGAIGRLARATRNLRRFTRFRGAGSAPPNPLSLLQRSTVKVAYSKNRKSPAWKAHGSYLQREGAQREGERGLGFGADRDDTDLAKVTDRWQRADDPHMFKLIVSPENAAKLDLRQHARDLMALLEERR